MAFVWTTAGRNIKCTTGITPACANGKIKVYTAADVLLVTFTLGAIAFGAPVTGVITANAIASATPVANGVATKYTLCQSDDTPLGGGTVSDTSGSGDLKLNNTTLATTSNVSVTSFTHTEPAS